MSVNLFQSIFYIGACFLFIFVSITYTKILRHFLDQTSLLKRPTFINLDADDFKCLVRGGILKVAYMQEEKAHLIKVKLSDIGFHVMEKALVDAANKKDIYVDHNKIIG